jgi:hypothetical protein
VRRLSMIAEVHGVDFIAWAKPLADSAPVIRRSEEPVQNNHREA